MDTPPRPPHATPPGQPARAHNVRGRPPVPSGSPAGGGPCGDPDVGAACGALGRARPRLVPLGSQCSVGGREPRPESCGGAAGQPAVPMRGRGVRGQGPDVSGRGLASQQPWGSQGPGRQEAAGGETVVIAEADSRGWAVAVLPRRADARGRGCRLDARCPHWAPPWGRRRRILLELSGQGGRARGPWAPDTSACLGLGSRSRRARAAGTGRPLLTRGSPGVPEPEAFGGKALSPLAWASSRLAADRPPCPRSVADLAPVRLRAEGDAAVDVDAAVAARVLALEAEHKVKLSLLQTALEEEVDLLRGENRRLREELQSEARLNEDLEKVRGASAGGPTAASGGRLPAGRDISRTRGRPGAGSVHMSLRPDEPPAAWPPLPLPLVPTGRGCSPVSSEGTGGLSSQALWHGHLRALSPRALWCPEPPGLPVGGWPAFLHVHKYGYDSYLKSFANFNIRVLLGLSAVVFSFYFGS